jgi:hypothetical protein
MKIHNDMELRRARRTLSEVKNKLEEALRLSQLQNKGTYGESAAPSDRRR